jgi:hypothetical protein
MKKTETEKFIQNINELAEPILELVKVWIDSDEDDHDLQVPLFALSKVSAIHLQAMVIGLELDEQEKEKLIQFFIGSVRAALTDLDGFVKSEEVITKMMGKP